MIRLAKRLALIASVLGSLASPGLAIDIGDPAPEVQVATWVKNGPVDLAKGKGKQIYVVEFWATWCGPCLQSIPHLTELQNKYRDQGVVVIGITDETPAVVKPFVEKMGDKMGYAVGIDKRELTHRNYMAAFGIDGIPYAFVIDKSGALAWHGHPQSGLDRVVDRLAKGKFDIKQAKQEAAAVKLLEKYAEGLERINGTVDKEQLAKLRARAKEAGETLLKQAAQCPDVLHDLASMIVLSPDLDFRDLELAGRAAEAAYEAGEKTPAEKARRMILDYFRVLRSADSSKPTEEKSKQKLREIGAAILENADPQQLNEFAWTAMMAPRLEPRDLQLALKAANKARIDTKDQEASILDTYARALFVNGQREKAIEYQRKAIEANKDKGLAPLLKQALEEYEKSPAK